jgi:hypothetical protein
VGQGECRRRGRSNSTNPVELRFCALLTEGLSRPMGLRVSVDVGGCPRDADFRVILVEECRPESGGWGRLGSRLGSKVEVNWLTSRPVHGTGEQCEVRHVAPKYFTEVSGRDCMKSGSSNVSSVDLADIWSPDGLKSGVLAHLGTTPLSPPRLFIQSRKERSRKSRKLMSQLDHEVDQCWSGQPHAPELGWGPNVGRLLMRPLQPTRRARKWIRPTALTPST